MRRNDAKGLPIPSGRGENGGRAARSLYDHRVHASEHTDAVRPIRQIAVFGPLGTDNVVELIVQRLRAVIGVGILEHGELLPSEPEMSEQFGVAVFSIREALAQLRGEGLIVTKRGRYGGSVVQRIPEQANQLLDERLQQMSTAELRDIGDWRLMMAAQEGELAADRASARNVTRLTTYLQRFREADTAAATAQAVGRLHMELAAAAQSSMISDAEVDFHARYGWLTVAGLEDQDCRSATVEDLTAMVRAIARRNGARARSSAMIYATRLTQSIQERRMEAVRSA